MTVGVAQLELRRMDLTQNVEQNTHADTQMNILYICLSPLGYPSEYWWLLPYFFPDGILEI